MVWTLSCLFTLPDVEEWEQLKGLSPFWVLSCASSKSICVFCLPCWQLNWFTDILSVVLNYDPNVPKLSQAVPKNIINWMLAFAIYTFRYSHIDLFSHLGCLVCGILSFVFLIYSNAFLIFWHSHKCTFSYLYFSQLGCPSFTKYQFCLSLFCHS